MKVLFDVNVLMDVFAEREPFYPAAASAWSAAEAGRVQGSFPPSPAGPFITSRVDCRGGTARWRR